MSVASKILEKRKGKGKTEQPGESATVNNFDFFKVKRDAEGNFKDVTIMQAGFLALLRRLGYRRYDIQESFIIVHIENNIIEEIPDFKLRERIVRYFYALDEEQLYYEAGCEKLYLIEKLHRSLGTLTTVEKLSLLVEMSEDYSEIRIVEDTKDKAFYFYRNGFVEVSKDGFFIKPYSELPGFIWKNQIINRDFDKISPKERDECIYMKFAMNVSNCKEVNGEWQGRERLASFMTITGYNLHRFFKTKLRCTIFLDSRMSDDPDGRSGKSLHCKAIREILNADPENGTQYVTVDGKRFDNANRFAFDQLSHNTKIVVFDDIKRGFSIEDFFNAIVDGLVRERKGDVNKIRIFAKLIFTLNYTIKISGGSAKDRVVEFEFADHYSSKWTPEQEFGHWFFRDWDETEYNRFDNWMMSCVAEYLRYGLMQADSINLNARKLREETCQEFINFMEDLVIQHEAEYDKKELYKQFADIDDDGNLRNKDFKWLKQRQFTKWLQLWAEFRPEIGAYQQTRRNNKDYIRFFNNRPLSEQYKDMVLLDGKSDNIKAIF